MSSRRGTLADSLPELRPAISARRAMAAMFGCFLVFGLIASGLHMAVLAGIGFAVGTVVAAGWTRRHELIMVVTTPPAIFLVAVTFAELISMHLSHVRLTVGLVGANVFLTLSAAAPWIFCGLAGALLIATARGLPQCIRRLRADLQYRQPARPPTQPGSRPGHGAG